MWMLTLAVVRLYLRDRLTVVLSLALIVFMMVLFGLVMGDDQYQVSLPLAVVDQAHDDASARLLRELRSDPLLHVEQVRDEAAIRAGLHRATAVAGLIVGPGYSGDHVADGVRDGLRVVTTQVDSKWTAVALDRLQAAINRATGVQAHAPWQRVQRDIATVKSRYIDFIFPGILAMAVMQACLAAGVVLLHAKEIGILRRLQLTPMSPATLLGGFISGRLIIVLIHLLVLTLVATLGFGAQIQGHWFPLLVALALGSAVFMSLGLMLAIVAPSLESGNLMVQLLSLPMSFLCGVFFKLDSIPDFLAWLPKLLPLTYLVSLVRGMVNYGAPLSSFRGDLLVLCGWLVGTLLVSMVGYRRLQRDGG
jgi:ABC-2 type transport system permease protein